MAMKFRKILTKALVVLLLLVAVVLGVRGIFNYIAGQKLEKYLEAAKAEGIPLRVKDLVPACPDSDNAATLWKAAEELFQIDRDDRDFMNKTMNDFFRGKPFGADARERLTALAAKNRRLIDLVVEAGTRSCLRYGDWSLPAFEVPRPKAINLIQTVRLLAIDAVLRADRGEVGEALDECRKGMRFVRLLADEPLLINILVAVADMKILLASFNSIVQDRTIAPELLTSWIAELDPLPWRSRFIRCIPGERAYALEIGLDVISGKAGINLNLESQGFFRRFLYWLIRPVLKSECLWVQKQYEDYLDMDTQSYWQAREFLKNKSLEIEHPPWPYRMIGQLLPDLHTVFYKEAMLEAIMLATRTGLGCRIYKKQTGHYPENLAALVPGILKEEPIDPFTGKPLVYRIQNGELLIYSLGSNLKDDGGRMTHMITQLVMDKDDDWTWREKIN
ncbi:MAG: hypothetical protein MUP19_11515 [Candidatus Aminicenantes bacterium]|nr:hypothetical protein [Candidatus Aminicenantes bacterium]